MKRINWLHSPGIQSICNHAHQKNTFAVDDFGLHSYLLASRVQRRAYEIVGDPKIANKLTFLEVEISCVRIA